MKPRLLPLIAAMITVTGVHAGDLQFTSAPVPTNDLDKRSVLTSQFAIVDGKQLDVNYNTIMRSGDQPSPNSYPFGTLVDINGNPVIDMNGDIRVSNDNDFSSLVHGDRHGGLFMVSHFESRPAAMYLTQLLQNPVTGQLKPMRTRPLDFSHVRGGWVHCAGSVAPWGNHIGSEEYPPDAKQWRDKTIDDYNAYMAQYFGVEPQVVNGVVQNQDEIIAVMNPYDYGFTIEVDVKNFNQASVVKHYAMGRVAIELSYVMPNEKTVYTSDDGSRVGLFRFEADREGDLSSGALYAAKFSQTSYYAGSNERVADDLRDGGAGNISWIELGHANDAEIRAIIDRGVTFADIFDEDVTGCTTIINRDTGSSGECLKLKTSNGLGMSAAEISKAAAFLETSRYAGLMGATTEWEKMEGITLDPDTNIMYLAMSRVRNAMTDGTGDISVPYNYCGTVYGLDLDPNYVATNMYGVVAGLPRTYGNGALVDNLYPADGPYAKNECDLNAIAEPDNLTFIPGYKTLIIGEDTGEHQNDMIWAFNVERNELTRVQTTPYGSETTSPYFYADINGFSYIMSVIQHPFGESDQNALLVPKEARGYTGYLGPFPAAGSDD